MAAMEAVWVGGLEGAQAEGGAAAPEAVTTAPSGGMNGWAGLAFTLGLGPSSSNAAPSLQPPNTLLSGEYVQPKTVASRRLRQHPAYHNVSAGHAQLEFELCLPELSGEVCDSFGGCGKSTEHCYVPFCMTAPPDGLQA